MNQERRADKRVVLNLPVKWDGLSGEYGARIEDLSVGGCFVNTRGVVTVGEIITIEIKLPSGEWMQLRGEVTSVQEAIGFGLAFSFLTDEEERTLQQLLSSQLADANQRS
jgi:Tfp pilus assembly protein PilZ